MNYDRKTKKELIRELEHLNKRIEGFSNTADFQEQITFWEMLFEHASEGVMITDINHSIMKVNPGFCTITGFSAEEAVGKKPNILRSGRHEANFYKQLKTSLTKDGKWEGEIWNRRKNGEIYPEWLTIVKTDNPDKANIKYIGIFTDITKYINRNANVRNHAYFDTLTGLPNRILLYDRLSFMLNHAKRNKQIMSILRLDLNRFKFINDTLGYSIGDSLLQNVAERLKSCVRDVDAVFRLGDDEFAIILEEIAQPQDAARVAKRILGACSSPFQIANHELYINISIGISIFPADGEDLEVLLKNSEIAMIRAKELGINNYQHYMPNMNSKAFEQLTLEHNLRKALKNNEFVVYYQPIVELASERIIGAEALVRWKHPELGMISPGQFIPLAEETGLILPIGELVLRTACEQAKKWRIKYGKFVISVNLSARQFQQQDLVLTISKVLRDSDLRPDSLELEITESLGMKNPELTLKTLHELKAMGIHIAIDDFGTGYSSLSYLKRFPIDTLKIDRSFVTDLHNDQNDAAIVLAVIALAHSLRLKVVAEGVELKEQSEYLLQHECERVQGYLYSPPVSMEEFELILSKSPDLVLSPEPLIITPA